MLSPALPHLRTRVLLSLALPVAAAALVAVLAFAVTGAEAAGDVFGDNVTVDGEIDGTATDVLGPDDDTIVQIGTEAGGGSVTVSFDDNLAFDGPGSDVRIHTLDALAPATATIEVSADGVTFVSAGNFPDDAGDIDIDLGALGLDFAVAVRITYVSGELPGFDLDAVEALNHIDLVDLTLALEPATASNLVGDDHTVAATVTVAASPVEAALVSFLVTAGPNATDGDTAVSDAAGEATFTYTGDGGAGSDAITAWLDLDSNGVVDAGEPQAAAAKDWLALGDLGITATPNGDTNPVNTQHTVTATLSPTFDGVSVRFRVVAGPNSGDNATVATSGGGVAAFTYTGDGAAGTDAITAWIDVDGEGDIDAGEPQDTVTKTWTETTATTVSLSPTPDTNPVGTSHTLTATLSPSTVGAVVRFEVVTGPHFGSTGVDATDASSQATFTYVGTTVGTDVIIAWHDQDNDGVRDSDEAQAIALKTWTSQGAASMTLDPASDTNPIGSTHTLTATVSPGLSGVLVRFDVISGPHIANSGLDVTDAAGQATFAYTGSTIGNDVILAWADLDGDAQPDSNEPQAIATKEWVTQPSVDNVVDGVVDGSVQAEKVTICHVPPGNPSNTHMITVGAPAVASHLAQHGDTLGPCPATTSTTQQQQRPGQGSAKAANNTQLAKRIRAECNSQLDGLPNSLGALKSVLASAGIDLVVIEALLDARNCAQITLDLQT